MAMIKTRTQQDPILNWVIKELTKIATFVNPTKKLPTLDNSLDQDDQIQSLFNSITKSCDQNENDFNKLVEVADDLEYENEKLIEAFNTQKKILEDLTNIRYDDALDHATLDFMDAMSSNGSAYVSDEGNILFNERCELTKGDMKPLVREAISGWVQCRLK